jgi:cell division septation protein DedD
VCNYDRVNRIERTPRKRPGDREPDVSVRMLDQIEEQDPDTAPRSRVAALVMASFAGACVVFAALALMRTPPAEKPQPTDPLGDLVSRSAGQKPKSDVLDPGDVTFPRVLTDRDDPTTAMAAVRPRGYSPPGPVDASAAQLPGDAPVGPPPATDRLPVVPLPAQDLLGGAPNEAPIAGDMLRTIATHVSREPEGAQLAEPGTPGGYQLQVSSFKTREEADGFASVLRRRGHRAHVEEANVRGRGLWFRVRIGPFKYRRSAEIYRQDFEGKERMVTFIVDPPKAKIRITESQEQDQDQGQDRD